MMPLCAILSNPDAAQPLRAGLDRASMYDVSPYTNDPVHISPDASVALALTAIARSGLDFIPVLGEVVAGEGAYGGRRFLGFVHANAIFRWLAERIDSLTPDILSSAPQPRSIERALSSLAASFAVTQVSQLPSCAAYHAIINGDVSMSALDAVRPIISNKSDGSVAIVAVVGAKGELLHTVSAKQLASFIYHSRHTFGLTFSDERGLTESTLESLATPLGLLFDPARRSEPLVSATMPAWRAISHINSRRHAHATIVNEIGVPITHISSCDLRSLLTVDGSTALAFVSMQPAHRANHGTFTPTYTQSVAPGPMRVNTALLAGPILEIASLTRRLTLEARIPSLALQPSDTIWMALSRLAVTGWSHLLVIDEKPWFVSISDVCRAATYSEHDEGTVTKGLVQVPVTRTERVLAAAVAPEA